MNRIISFAIALFVFVSANAWSQEHVLNYKPSVVITHHKDSTFESVDGGRTWRFRMADGDIALPHDIRVQNRSLLVVVGNSELNVQLATTDPYQLRIYDLNGCLVQSENVSSVDRVKFPLNVSLSKGAMYLLVAFNVHRQNVQTAYFTIIR